MGNTSTQLEFEKFHGASNDFIFIQSSFLSRFNKQVELKNFVIETCHRTRGVGADGVVFYDFNLHKKENLKKLEVKIFIVNSDGSFAATCGNALRCLGLKLMQDNLWQGEVEVPVHRLIPYFALSEKEVVALEEQFIFQAEYFAILVNAKITSSSHVAKKALVSVAMGREKEVKATPLVENSLAHFGNELDFLTPIYVALSNPHWVFISPIFQNFNKKMFEEFGVLAQTSLRSKTLTDSVPLSNIGMITLINKSSEKWDLVVYERGAGLTECCGSGSVAACVALEFSGHVSTKSNEKTEVYFQMPGGTVSISAPKTINGEEGQRVLTGPAEWVFQGYFS